MSSKIRMQVTKSTEEATLFPLPPPDEVPLRVTRGLSHFNYRRLQTGQNLKINLRDCRTGKIIATIYGGERMADHIVECINSYGKETFNEKND